jgi:hypothetical protein
MNIKCTTILLLFAFIASALADDASNTPKCEYPKSFYENNKTEYVELQKVSMNLGIQLCKDYLFVLDEEAESFDKNLANYVKLAKDRLQTDFPDTYFKGVKEISNQWEWQVLNFKDNFDYLSVIDINGKMFFDEEDQLEIKLPTKELFIPLLHEQEKACMKITNKTCFESIDNLNSAIKPAFALLNERLLQNNRAKLTNLQEEWKLFIKEARYQTPLDVWATTTLQSNYFTGKDLVGPPKWQAFLLRPSIVFEHIAEAEKGSKDDLSLALEWAGMNLWEKGIGVSFTSIYNDREGIDSVGHGLTFHIKNKYSFGYVHRDNDNGSYFFNIDLLEFFGENKDVYKKYKQYF